MTTCRKYFPILSSFIYYHQVCNYINITGDTRGEWAASRTPELTTSSLWSSRYPIVSFMFMFCRSLFELLCFFFWPLCCLFFFDIRMLIAPLVSSNSSLEWYIYIIYPICENINLDIVYLSISNSSDFINILKIFASTLWRSGGMCSSSKFGKHDQAENGLKMTNKSRKVYQLGW